jgi:ubiquinone/menaquinone biosynthesis C-methylase UbiE
MTLQSDYDLWHQRIHDANPAHDDASSPWYTLVREYIGEVAGLRMLEVACGRGGFLRELTRAGAHVTGCDFSLSAVNVARLKARASGPNSSATLVQGDLQRLPFTDGAFDALVCCETIEHVPHVQAAVCELWRVTRPGGKLFLTTPNYLNFMGLYELYALARHPQKKDDQPFDRRQWFPQVHRWLKRAGWTILQTDGTVHQFPILPRHNPIRWKSLEANPKIRKLLSPFAYTYFVAAEKKAGPRP